LPWGDEFREAGDQPPQTEELKETPVIDTVIVVEDAKQMYNTDQNTSDVHGSDELEATTTLLIVSEKNCNGESTSKHLDPTDSNQTGDDDGDEEEAEVEVEGKKSTSQTCTQQKTSNQRKRFPLTRTDDFLRD
jgi:hypothetical protein